MAEYHILYLSITFHLKFLGSYSAGGFCALKDSEMTSLVMGNVKRSSAIVLLDSMTMRMLPQLAWEPGAQ